MDPQPVQRPTVLVLPNEMIVLMLRQLNLPDLINCRAVSKRFRDLIDEHLKIRDLFVFKSDLPPRFSFATPNPRYLLQQSDSSILRSVSFIGCFSMSLRSLKISLPLSEPSDLNQFRSLERLYAQQITIDCEVRLSLPKLRTLVIADFARADQQSVLVVDAEILEKLKCYRLPLIKLVHYDAVRQLTTGDYDFNYEHLPMFKKVRALRFEKVFGVEDVDQHVRVISALEDLTELHLDWHRSVREEIRARIDQKVKQIWTRKAGLRIVLMGIELSEENCTKLIGRNLAGWTDYFKLQVENYQSLSTVLEGYWQEIYYPHLSLFERQAVPGDFCRKFCNIRSIVSRKISDADRFVRFINSCRDLNLLRFSTSGLQRSFYDRLSLNRLSLYDLRLDGQNSEIDFGFIYKLDYLCDLRIIPELSCETVISFFERCKYLGKLEFVAQKRRFVTLQSAKGSFQLTSCDSRSWTDLSFHDWSELCKLLLSDVTLTRSRSKRLKISP